MTLEGLRKLREKEKVRMLRREGKEETDIKEIMLCTGTGCVSGGAFKIGKVLKNEIRKHKVKASVVFTGCQGFCGQGPLCVVMPDRVFYGWLKPENAGKIITEYILRGKYPEEFLYRENGGTIPIVDNIPFFRKQVTVALRNKGIIDPERIEDYIARDGYTALERVLFEMRSEDVIDELKKSGLRGRGGAGFPTGLKWEVVRRQRGEKYLICNGDEGDPGAFMDRSILESDPHTVLEGMIIGAYAMGANFGYIYIRNEYPLALRRIQIAVKQARNFGLLGDDILGSGFSFDVEIVRGAGAFVAGEETALIASVEGRLAEPKPRPPYPAERGVWGKPTCINNVETWANVPVIILEGGEWFASMGTEKSKGTKVFSLVGKVRNVGLIEVPMGITLHEIIYDIGGGISRGRFKAVQIGGPSGGCLPESLLDLPVDYESLTDAGAMMGSGGMVVMDDKTCMVEVARYFLSFTQDESCGKCTPCREGTKKMLEILEKLTRGEGRGDDIDILKDIAETTRKASLCGLGKTAPNPILTTLRYFGKEYEAHIQGRCPAKVCRPLLKFTIDSKVCVEDGHGCGMCRRECPFGAISGEKGKAHIIDQSRCQKCSVCYEVCRFKAVIVE